MRTVYPTYLKKRHIAVILVILLLNPLAHADSDTTSKTEEPPPSIKALERLDSKRDAASRQVIRFANWFDNFFANDNVYDERQASYVKLYLSQTYFENDKPVFDTKLKAKLAIPKTQKRIQLIIESNDDEDSDESLQISQSEDPQNQEQSIGLRFIQAEAGTWRINTDAGLRFRSGIDTFARLRFRRIITEGSWKYRISENIFWYSSDGLGETTRLDIDRNLTENILFRSTTQVTWRNINDYFDLGQDLSLFQNINKRKAIAYRAGVRGINDSQLYATDYILSVHYREQIHKGWLFLEVIPQINHPKDNDYKPVRSITLKLETVFDAL